MRIVKKNCIVDKQKGHESAREFEELKPTENTQGLLCVKKWVR